MDWIITWKPTTILKVWSKTEKSGKKLAIGLMVVDTTTNLLPSGLTIYRLQ
jgi:hypothetical protein